jgi:hypothetical protein
MNVVHASCAGIDIGKRSVTICAITTGPRGDPVKETRTFGTVTRDLLALADWLDGIGVRAVAMEATGSYWKPIHNLSSRTVLSCSLRTRPTSRPFPVARPTSGMPNGSPISSATASSERASSRPVRNVSCASSSGTGRA